MIVFFPMKDSVLFLWATYIVQYCFSNKEKNNMTILTHLLYVYQFLAVGPIPPCEALFKTKGELAQMVERSLSISQTKMREVQGSIPWFSTLFSFLLYYSMIGGILISFVCIVLCNLNQQYVRSNKKVTTTFCKSRQKHYVTRGSQVIPQPSTNLAQPRLTSEF